jgi:plasmid maintenance system antidote protein VapI
MTPRYSFKKYNLLMMNMEKIAACLGIHKKRINTLCGQNAEFGIPKRVVQKITTKF